MFNSKSSLSIILGIINGSLFYVILNIIPLIGPLFSGIISGRISNGGLLRGFFVGISSGILGFLLFLYVFYNFFRYENIFIKTFFFLGIFIWNFFGIIISGIGGIIGATLLFKKSSPLSSLHPSSEKEKDSIKTSKTFVICKKCKRANKKGNKVCNSCGEKL